MSSSEILPSQVPLGTVEGWLAGEGITADDIVGQDAIARLFGVQQVTVRSWRIPAIAAQNGVPFPPMLPRDHKYARPYWSARDVISWGRMARRIDSSGRVWTAEHTNVFVLGHRKPGDPDSRTRRQDTQAGRREERQAERTKILTDNGWITTTGIAEALGLPASKVNGQISRLPGFPPSAGRLWRVEGGQPEKVYDAAAFTRWKKAQDRNQ